MIPMGYEYESMRVYLFATVISLLWLITIGALFVRWLKQSFSKLAAMAFWDWAELSSWLLVISVLSVYDSYLIFFR